VVRYQGGTMNGAPYPSARAGIDAWRARSHASSAPVKTRRRTLFFEPVAVERFDAPEARVALWTVEGGDHGLRALRFFAPELVAFLSGS